jgi:sporulation protein YlmC with PRC-barrel domain
MSFPNGAASAPPHIGVVCHCSLFRALEPLEINDRFNQHNWIFEEDPMSKVSTAVAFAAIMAAAMPAAYAQTMAHPDSPAPATSAAASTLWIQPDQVRASQMIGSTVYDVQNRDIGSVKDLVLDKDGRVASVVVDVGSFLGVGGKYVAVRLSDLKSDNNRLTLDLTKGQLQQMAEYHLTDRNTGAGETTSPPTGGQMGH